MRNRSFSTLTTRACLLGLLFLSFVAQAQVLTNLAGEYPIVGNWGGDQTQSKVAFNSAGGWVVWRDNTIDGAGAGIGARHLDSTLSGDFAVFRVNSIGAGEQENPQVTMLQDGGAAFVWQGGRVGFQKIFARFMTAGGTFINPSDVGVNSYTNQFQIDPAIACLSNGNVVVTWSSSGQDGSKLGVFGQVLSASGDKVGSEFQVNQTTNYNQRSSAVVGLDSGGFAVVWISEIARTPTTNDTRAFNAEVMGRLFSGAGAPIGGEFLISSGNNVCADPSVASMSGGGFVVTWSQNDTVDRSNGWDIYGRVFSAAGIATANAFRINTQIYGDDYTPHVVANGTNCFAVWTSLGQDGSYEGVYAQAFTATGGLVGVETRVNTTTASRQIEPSVAVDASGRYLVVWSSYVGGGNSFDLYGQRFETGDSLALPAPPAPYLSAVSSNALSATWPDLAGYPVAFYELYVDSDSAPIIATGNFAAITNLQPSTTHTVQLLYQLSDGQRSTKSPPASGRTWGVDANNDGLPDDWETAQWGSNPAAWPNANADSDGDGANNITEFICGTNPNDAESVLRTRMHRTQQGLMFSWNTQPGLVYQVQSATTLGAWQNVGLPRFARSVSDSFNLGSANPSGFYRVIRLR